MQDNEERFGSLVSEQGLPNEKSKSPRVGPVTGPRLDRADEWLSSDSNDGWYRGCYFCNHPAETVRFLRAFYFICFKIRLEQTFKKRGLL